MKKFFGVVSVICIAVFIAGCTQQIPTRVYRNSQYDFSLNPPESWKEIEQKSTDVAVLFSPVNSSNVTFVIGKPFSLSEGLSISTFADLVEENLSGSRMNYSILRRDWRIIPGVQAYEIAYSFWCDSMNWTVKQVAVLRTRTVFLMTFTAPSKLYADYLASVDQCINTFL